MKAAVATLACFVFVLVLPARSSEQLTMKLTPPAAMAPAALTVKTTVNASPDNRLLRIQIDSGEYFRSSEIELDGERARRVEEWVFRGLPAGRYEITATLLTATGTRATANQWFQATGSLGR